MKNLVFAGALLSSSALALAEVPELPSFAFADTWTPVSAAVNDEMSSDYRFDKITRRQAKYPKACDPTIGRFEALGFETNRFYNLTDRMPDAMAAELGVLPVARHVFPDRYEEPTVYQEWVGYTVNPLNRGCVGYSEITFGAHLAHTQAYKWNYAATFLTEDLAGNPTIVYATFNSSTGHTQAFRVRYIWNRTN